MSCREVKNQRQEQAAATRKKLLASAQHLLRKMVIMGRQCG